MEYGLGKLVTQVSFDQVNSTLLTLELDTYLTEILLNRSMSDTSSTHAALNFAMQIYCELCMKCPKALCKHYLSQKIEENIKKF